MGCVCLFGGGRAGPGWYDAHDPAGASEANPKHHGGVGWGAPPEARFLAQNGQESGGFCGLPPMDDPVSILGPLGKTLIPLVAEGEFFYCK